MRNRMPVIVAAEAYSSWLGGAEGMLQPCPAAAIEIRRVSRAVNSARNDSPALLEPSED